MLPVECGGGADELAPASPSAAARVAGCWPLSAFSSPRRPAKAGSVTSASAPVTPGVAKASGMSAAAAADGAAGVTDTLAAPRSSAGLLSLPADVLQRVLVDTAHANLAAQQLRQQLKQQEAVSVAASARAAAVGGGAGVPNVAAAIGAPVQAAGDAVMPLRPQETDTHRHCRRSFRWQCHHVPAASAAAACRGLRDAWRAALCDPSAMAQLLVARCGRRGVAALHVYGMPAARIRPTRVVAVPPRSGYVVMQETLVFLGPPRISRDGLEAYCMLQGAGPAGAAGSSGCSSGRSSTRNSSGGASCGGAGTRSREGGGRGGADPAGDDVKQPQRQGQREPRAQLGCTSPCLRALLRGLPPERHNEAVMALVRALAAQGGLGDLELPPAGPPWGQPPLADAPPVAAISRPPTPPGLAPVQDEIIFLPAAAFGRGRGYYAAFRPQLQPPTQHGQQQAAATAATAGRVGRGPAAAAAAALLRGAAAWDHGDLVRALVGAGAPAFALAEGLLGACEGGHVGLARELLAALGVPMPLGATTHTGATMDATAGEGSGHLLVSAAPLPHPPLPLGRPASPASRERQAALLVAPLAAASQGRSAGHTALVRLLLAVGADPRAEHSEALACAAACGNRPAMRQLLAAGADPRAAGTLHPLVSAAEFLRLGSVLSLLATGAFSVRDLAGAARKLLIPPFLSTCVSGVTLVMSWLLVAALLLAASAPLVMVCVLACLWNGLWVVRCVRACAGARGWMCMRTSRSDRVHVCAGGMCGVLPCTEHCASSSVPQKR